MKLEINKLWLRVRTFVKTHKLALFTLLIFAVLAVYYMYPVPAMCKSAVISPGDATSGLVSKNKLVPNNPLWGYTSKLDYPQGENLNQPLNWSAPGFYTAYWTASKVAGPVCGLNIVNAGGYVFTAFIMFLFIYWLLQSYWLALLAGYAVSFTPYFQSKIGGHPSYGYTGLLISLFWLLLLVWQKRERRYIALLGLNTAFLAYWDPYFVLLGAVLITGVVGSLVGYNWFTKRSAASIKEPLKRLLLAAALTGVLLLPIAYVRVHYASSINGSVSNARNDLKFQAYAYSNRPIEYLLPASTHPVLNKIFGADYQKINRHYSNAAEFTVGLSLTLLFIVSCFGLITLWEKLTKGKVWPKALKLPVAPGMLLLTVTLTLLLAFWVALPPRYGPLYNPSYFITSLVSMWRVFSRLYVVVNIMLVTLAVVALAYFAANITKKQLKIAIYLLIGLAVFFEYQAYRPNSRYWSYNNSAPAVYQTLAHRSDIQNIAEYPLDEGGSLGLLNNYMTNEYIHGKNLLNATLSTSSQKGLRRAVADLEDPQTLPILRALSIQAVVIHGPLADTHIPGLELIDSDVPAGVDTANMRPARLYKILPGPFAREAIIPGDDETEVRYSFLTGSVLFAFRSNLDLQTENLHGQPVNGHTCFVVQAEEPAGNDITVNGQRIHVNQSGIHLSLEQSKTTLQNLQPKSMVFVSDLGCQ